MVIMTIAGDFFIKKASLLKDYSGWKLLLLGALFYGFSAIGWFWVYRTTKYFTVGAIHSFGTIILTIFIAILFFKEKINIWEGLGILFGIISLVLLMKNENI
jgi:drug/metabolite transporter (DMT)-like permease